MFMQRLAILSFVGVLLLLFAFTARESKKPAPVYKVAGQSIAFTLSVGACAEASDVPQR
jgi:signal peptidase I